MKKVYITSLWARKILDGEKQLETSSFSLPDRYKNIDLHIQTETGFVIGILRFYASFKFVSETHFNNFYDQHLVNGDSPFHFINRNKSTHGWWIDRVKRISPKMARPFKSQFRLEGVPVK